RSSFFSVLRRPPRSPLFPYPTLFRSRRGPPPTPPGAPAAPAAGVPGTSDGHYGGTRGPPGSGCDSRQATPHSEVLLTSTNHCECHQRPGRVQLEGGEHVEVVAVGAGEVDPLVDVVAAEGHRAAGAVVPGTLGAAQDVRHGDAAGAPDEGGERHEALVAGLRRIVERGCV